MPTACLLYRLQVSLSPIQLDLLVLCNWVSPDIFMAAIVYFLASAILFVVAAMFAYFLFWKLVRWDMSHGLRLGLPEPHGVVCEPHFVF